MGGSLFFMIVVRIGFRVLLVVLFFYVFRGRELVGSLSLLFPGLFLSTVLFFGSFIFLFLLNVIRLICFRYPVTTTLSFNFSLAFRFWLSTILILFIKPVSVSRLLPLGSPWYLVSFLSVVEVVRLVVRPVTLCFRLLANMSAGHIMLGLMCKLPFGVWLLGRLFGILELMVAAVQAFVFTMLVRVYFMESLSH